MLTVLAAIPARAQKRGYISLMLTVLAAIPARAQKKGVTFL
jgi:hypothetical protein